MPAPRRYCPFAVSRRHYGDSATQCHLRRGQAQTPDPRIRRFSLRRRTNGFQYHPAQPPRKYAVPGKTGTDQPTHKTAPRFKPTKIAIESPSRLQHYWDSIYQDYREGKPLIGKYPQPADETLQLACRLAKLLKLEKLYAIDEDRILVIYGATHAYILKQLFTASPEFQWKDILDYLK